MRIEQACNSPIQTFDNLKPGTAYKAKDGKIYIKAGWWIGDIHYILDPDTGTFYGSYANNRWETQTTVVEVYPNAKIVLKG